MKRIDMRHPCSPFYGMLYGLALILDGLIAIVSLGFFSGAYNIDLAVWKLRQEADIAQLRRYEKAMEIKTLDKPN